MEKFSIINAGQIITGNGNVLGSGSMICVENGAITYVGPENRERQSEHMIDADQMTVMPGLIDAHIHFQGSLPPKPFGRRHFPELSLLKAINDAETLIHFGFTSVRDCGGMNGLYIKEAASIGLLKNIPRVIACGNVLVPTNYGLDDPQLPDVCFDARTNRSTEFLISDGAEACLKSCRIAVRNGADFIKIFQSGNYAFPHCDDSISMFTESELSAIVEAARQAGGKIVAAHCQSDDSCRKAILCGVKSIEHAVGISKETAAIGTEKGVIFTSALTFAKNEPNCSEETWEKLVSGYKNIREAGGLLAIGSDMNGSDMFPFGYNARELEYLVNYCGFTALEAITVGTRNGAIALGIENKTGTIEAGKSADLLIVNGDPLTDIRILSSEDSIKKVFINGVSVKSN